MPEPSDCRTMTSFMDTIPVCAVEECDRTDIQGRGWCAMHYARWLRHGNTDRVLLRRADCKAPGCDRKAHGLELCAKHLHRLKRTGTIDDPIRRPRNHGTTSMYQSGCRCAECDARMKRHVRERRLRTKYQMSTTDFDRMLADQGGVCAICRKPPKNGRFDVDHDHACCPSSVTCGRCVRGLLCGRCNKGLGLLEDEGFRSAANAYLGRLV